MTTCVSSAAKAGVVSGVVSKPRLAAARPSCLRNSPRHALRVQSRATSSAVPQQEAFELKGKQPQRATAPSPLTLFADLHSFDGWLKDELENLLVGIEASTSRAKVITTGITALLAPPVIIKGNKGNNRCEALDVMVSWEGIHKNEEAKIKGVARVKYGTRDDIHDVVEIGDVEIKSPCPTDRALRDAQRSVADVLFAVGCLESRIMDQLNALLIDVESTVCSVDSDCEDHHHFRGAVGAPAPAPGGLQA